MRLSEWVCECVREWVWECVSESERLVGWLVGGWLVGWLVGWLGERLTNCGCSSEGDDIFHHLKGFETLRLHNLCYAILRINCDIKDPYVLILCSCLAEKGNQKFISLWSFHSHSLFLGKPESCQFVSLRQYRQCNFSTILRQLLSCRCNSDKAGVHCNWQRVPTEPPVDVCAIDGVSVTRVQ